MKKCFVIPTTRLVQVNYMRGNVLQSAILPNPKSNDDLIVAMLKKQVGASQIRSVNEVIERAPRQ